MDCFKEHYGRYICVEYNNLKGAVYIFQSFEIESLDR